jgi:hypothetical protein
LCCIAPERGSEVDGEFEKSEGGGSGGISSRIGFKFAVGEGQHLVVPANRRQKSGQVLSTERKSREIYEGRVVKETARRERVYEPSRAASRSCISLFSLSVLKWTSSRRATVIPSRYPNKHSTPFHSELEQI